MKNKLDAESVEYPKEKLTTKAYIYGVIFSLANRLQNQGDSRDETVTTKQWFALANIAMFNDFSLNIKQLAQIIGTSSQNTKKLVDLLIRKGYVEMQKDPEDKRNLRIALSKQGKEYYQERSIREEMYLENLFEGLSENEVEQLHESLRLFSANVIKKEEK